MDNLEYFTGLNVTLVIYSVQIPREAYNLNMWVNKHLMIILNPYKVVGVTQTLPIYMLVYLW